MRILSRILVGKCVIWKKRLADGLSSSQSTPIKCLNQHLLSPPQGGSSNHASGSDGSNPNNAGDQSSHSANRANGVGGTNSAIDQTTTENGQIITFQDGKTIPLSEAYALKRIPTPPHIAGGRGVRAPSFDKYIFI